MTTFIWILLINYVKPMPNASKRWNRAKMILPVSFTPLYNHGRFQFRSIIIGYPPSIEIMRQHAWYMIIHSFCDIANYIHQYNCMIPSPLSINFVFSDLICWHSCFATKIALPAGHCILCTANIWSIKDLYDSMCTVVFHLFNWTENIYNENKIKGIFPVNFFITQSV